jgi:CRISPR-associated protein Cas2
MFDLPVIEKDERKSATEFRNALLDMGFEMSQFSVYLRLCTSPAQFETYCARVEAALPEGGHVNILPITDKQYERMISYRGRRKNAMKKSVDQFDLF